MANNVLIIAGEKSGEEHALTFFPQLKKLLPDCHFWGVGGDDLSSLGMELVYHLKDFSSMGFSEVVGKIPFYWRAMNVLLTKAKFLNCQKAILIDFQDFNLRIAQRLKQQNVDVFYYVAPQAWAWKSYRAEILAKTVHTLFTILPFEKNWFQSRGVKQVFSIPHPAITRFKDVLPAAKKHSSHFFPFSKRNNCTIKILLLPGSRRSEILAMLPEYLQSIHQLKEKFPQNKIQVGLVRPLHIQHSLYQSYLKDIDQLFFDTDLPTALTWADFAYATSGTITLITALFNLPTIVCYKTSLFNEFIFHTFIKYQGHISLCNIVHNKSVFPELTQESFSSFNINQIMLKWLTSFSEYEQIATTLNKTYELLTKDCVQDNDVASYLFCHIKD